MCIGPVDSSEWFLGLTDHSSSMDTIKQSSTFEALSSVRYQTVTLKSQRHTYYPGFKLPNKDTRYVWKECSTSLLRIYFLIPGLFPPEIMLL